MAKTLYLIDGHYQVYRAFYAAPRNLSTPSGEPTGAIHVFGQMLLNLIRDRRPDYLAILMDVSDRTVFRCELDPEYKANRDPAPEELREQTERIVELLTALGVPVHRIEGFEADDLMATVARRLADDPIDIYLVSRDKDLEQLITDRVRMFDPTRNAVLDAPWLVEEKGYAPDQAVEIQTLTGDSTDNVPGVHGVGLKTAAKLIAKYGSAQAVLDHADELTPKACERVKAFADQLPITRRLVTLRADVPMEFDLDACCVERFTVADALPVLAELGLHRMREQMEALLGTVPAVPPAPASSHAVPSSQPVMGEPLPGEPQYTLVDSSQALDDLRDQLCRQGAFAFDTETTGLNPVRAALVGISFSWRAGEGFYVPVRAAVGDVLPLDQVVETLRPVFEDDTRTKVAHNLKYDMLVLRQVGLCVAEPTFDTLLASFLLDPLRGSHSLDQLAQSLFDHRMIPISDLIGKGKNQITIDQVPTKIVSEYACEDADYTWRLKDVFDAQLKGSHVERLFRDTEMPLIAVLAEMEQNGFAIDPELLGKLGVELAQRMAALEQTIHEHAGHAFNIASTQQLSVVLFDELGLPSIKKTKTGRSTDASTLQTLVERTDHPVPKLVLEYRELAKLKGTYVDTLPKMVNPKTGRIHASFHQTGAITGRLSSSDPNLQNIPIRTDSGRRIREAFVAGDDEHLLLVADYSQIELRLLAHFCRDEALVRAFAEGEDIHRAVAAQVNGVALEDVTSKQRSAAKAVNFGIIYGQGAFGLGRSLGIPIGEAKVFIDLYFMRYPGIRLFIDKCIDDARRTGYAETILGRRRPIPELQSRNRTQIGFGERIAVNTVVQGSAADLIKRAMIDIHEELSVGADAARMIAQVHDELVFEVAASSVENVAKIVRDKMCNAIPLTVPIVVDISWGRTWAESK